MAHRAVLVEHTRAEGRIGTALLSGKELGLEDGKRMSHWLLSPRFPALHKPVASSSLTRFLLVHKQLY